MSRRKKGLRKGDIVICTNDAYESGFCYWYVENPDNYKGSPNEAEVHDISTETCWIQGLPKTDLQVVGHVDPFGDGLHDPVDPKYCGVVSPKKMEVLAPWLNKSPR